MLSYVICSSMRTGSNLLAKSLRGMGLGRPEEYFDDVKESGGIVEQRTDLGPPWDQYVSRIRRNNTVNDVFGIKVHHFQVPDWVMQRFTKLFPQSKYIWLTRRDVLRQAISLEMASQNKMWTSQMPKSSEAIFDVDGITKRIVHIATETCRWGQFFSRNSLSPLPLLYEDLEENYYGTMGRVLDFLGVTAEVPPQPIAKQADEVSEEWVHHYLEINK